MTQRSRLAGLGRAARIAAGAFAIALVSAAILTRVLAARAEAAFPMLGEHVTVEGLRQHVLVRGDGPPIVLVHGAYGGMQDFAATVLGELEREHRCVLWDRPGHGYSDRPSGDAGPDVQGRILASLVRELELERPLLVGFSYGGTVCLAAALEDPDAFRGVVLVNAPTHTWSEPDDADVRLARVPVLGRLISETVAAPLGRVLGQEGIERAFAPRPVPATFARSPIALALRPASYRANTQDVGLLKRVLSEQSPRYPSLDLPIVALVATEDRIVSPTNHIPQLERAAPNCLQIRIPDAGHQLLYTHPERVLAAIAEVGAD